MSRRISASSAADAAAGARRGRPGRRSPRSVCAAKPEVDPVEVHDLAAFGVDPGVELREPGQPATTKRASSASSPARPSSGRAARSSSSSVASTSTQVVASGISRAAAAERLGDRLAHPAQRHPVADGEAGAAVDAPTSRPGGRGTSAGHAAGGRSRRRARCATVGSRAVISPPGRCRRARSRSSAVARGQPAHHRGRRRRRRVPPAGGGRAATVRAHRRAAGGGPRRRSVPTAVAGAARSATAVSDQDVRPDLGAASDRHDAAAGRPTVSTVAPPRRPCRACSARRRRTARAPRPSPWPSRPRRSAGRRRPCRRPRRASAPAPPRSGPRRGRAA